jgi:deazaflavin-dependent oxidoreductase (nitroreductase family)
MNSFESIAINIENILMTRLVPLEKPGPLFKWLFKIPILFYKIGLPLFSDFILLLTTKGRKSGKLRYTPLEYYREEGTGYFIIMAGWGGRSDWQKNIQANQNVYVQAGWKSFEAVAEQLTEVEVASYIKKAILNNPKSTRIWSRWAGETVTLAEPHTVHTAAKYFPSFRLKPK